MGRKNEVEHCPKCGLSLRVGKSYYTTENDDTPDKQTEIYTNLEMICVNKDFEHTNKPCDFSIYNEKHDNYPNIVVHTIKHKVN